MIPTSGPNCGNICIASRECTHFRQTPNGFCFLKKIALSTPRSVVDGGMCGFIPWKFDSGKMTSFHLKISSEIEFDFSGRDHWNTEQSGVKWLINCDFPGHDIVQVKTTANNCGGTCLANPQCNHFRHSIDGTCYLKKAPLSTSRIPFRDGVCGFIPSRDFNNNNPPQKVNSCPNVAGLGTHCQPTIHCSVWYDDLLKTPGTSCKLASNGHGSCCPNIPSNSMLELSDLIIWYFYNFKFLFLQNEQ